MEPGDQLNTTTSNSQVIFPVPGPPLLDFSNTPQGVVDPFDLDKIQVVWKSVRDQMEEKLNMLRKSRGSNSTTPKDLGLMNIYRNLGNLVIESSQVSEDDIPSSLRLKIKNTTKGLVLAWAKSDMVSFADLEGLVDRLRLSVFPFTMTEKREHVGWDVFERFVEDLLHSVTALVVVDNECNESLGPFLKIKTNGFSHTEFSQDWPLWTTQVMSDVGDLGDEVKVPFDSLKCRMVQDVDVVMIGVGGCGKSRTCYDLCRFSGPFCVFLDWIYHVDLETFLDLLPFPPEGYRRKADEIQSFEDRVRGCIKRIMITRLLVLQMMIRMKPDFTSDEFFQLQQLGRVREKDIFRKIYEFLVSHVTQEDVDAHFESLIEWANSMNVRYVLDESHRLIAIHNGLYHSIATDGIDAKGLYLKPRSLLSFFARFLRENKMRSVWAGTHLRIGDIQKIVSAGRSKKFVRTITFTNFTFFTQSVIRKLVQKWVVTSDEQLVERIAKAFEGRPRIFMTFIRNLSLAPSDRTIEEVFVETESDLVEGYSDFWERAFDSRIHKFIPETETKCDFSVAELLIDLMCNNTLIDRKRHSNMAHYYRSMVTTGLVMLSEDRVGGRGLLCEPLIMKAAQKFSRQGLGRDLVIQTVINRFITMTPDESIRGKAIESICVVRIRECFWRDAFWRQLFPDSLLEMIDRGTIGEPRGVRDCRTGVREHAAILKGTFLTSDATHVVLTQARKGAADVIYGFFSFHLKTKWTNVKGGQLVISKQQSASNRNTIEKTYKGDTSMSARVESKPWVRFCFEFPTSANLIERGVHEIIERSGETVTITAGIESEITSAFFGLDFVDTVYSLTRNDS